MASGDEVQVKLDPSSEKRVQKKLDAMLAQTRKSGPELVKKLARNAANSAAKLTIPNKGRNLPRQNSKSPVRRPRDPDKFRPVVPAGQTGMHGNFYVLTSVAIRKSARKKKKGQRFNGVSRFGKGDKGVMPGSRGELVIYTKKRISQKDARFKKINRVIKVWDKKSNRMRFVPTMSKGKYDKQSKRWGKIPWYFTAKQAWLYSAYRISRMTRILNPKAKNFGSMLDMLRRTDNPAVQLNNRSKYAHKSGGRQVPRKAIQLAKRGLIKELEKTRNKIIDKAKRS